MKIVFQNISNDTWLAGTTCMEMLFHALRRLPEHSRPRLAITAWSNQNFPVHPNVLALADETITLPGPMPPHFDLTEYLRKADVDVFFSIPTATALLVKLPRIVWLYDFQHIHPANWLSKTEIKRRTELFEANAIGASRIMIKSKAIHNDLISQMPGCVDKVDIIPFVPCYPAGIRQADPSAVLKQYNLPERFFYMPNRFAHRKNHRLALEALRKLRDVGRAPVIVCTGQDGDPNDPGNLQELLRQRDDWQLQEQFMVLGAVPRNDMFLLMRQSVAVMTTTLFEGFGLSVVEARYLGKPVLASDLPVLREHQSPRISFFNPHDADDLARKMDEVWQHASLDKDRENEAAAEHDTAQQQFANDFMAMLESCC